MRILLFLFTLFTVAGPAAAQCDDKQTTLDIAQCLNAELKTANEHLTQSYNHFLKTLKAADAERLKKTQIAWRAYRDAQCKAEFELWDGGTGGQIALPQCILTLTKLRTAEIGETYKTEGH